MRPAGRAAWSTLVVVCLVSTLIGLNMSTLTIALPAVTRHFEASAFAGSWILLSYQVTSTACLLLVGRLSDTLGQRPLYLGGMLLFTVSCGLCGLAPTVEVLIALRVLAALGGAVLIANGATLIHAAFRQPQLGTAMGLYAASFPVAHLLGPTVGGAVVEVAGWEWVFWFNVPLGVVALVVGALLLPRGASAGADGVRPGLDLSGNTAIIVVVLCFVTGISLVTELSWASPLVWGSLLAAAAGMPVLLWLERRARHPVLDVGALARRGLGRIYLSTLFNGASRFPLVVLVSLYLQAVLQVSPTGAGLQILPMPVGSVLAGLMVGVLSKRLAPQVISALGSGVGLVGGVTVTVAVLVGEPWLLLPGLVLVGVGTGLFIGTNATALLDAAGETEIGVVNAMRLMMQNVGNVTSMALALTLLTAAVPDALSEQLIAATVGAGSVEQVLPGFHVAFVFLSALGVLGLWFTWPRRTPGVAALGHVGRSAGVGEGRGCDVP